MSAMSLRRRLLEEMGRVLAGVGSGEVEPARVYHEFAKLDGVRFPAPVGRFPGLVKRVRGLREVKLPSGRDVAHLLKGGLAEIIVRRRSRREYGPGGVRLEELAALLHFSVGIWGSKYGYPLRPYPSAGALQPVEVYPVIGDVDGVEPGIYHYDPSSSSLKLLRVGDWRGELMRIALDQEHVGEAPLDLVLTVVYARTRWKYGIRAYRYVHLDTGFAAQNIYLVAEALGLGTCAVGAFYDDDLSDLLGIDGWNEFPMLIMPVGRRR